MIRPNMRFCPELDSCADGVIRIATAHSASARGTFRQLSIEVCCKGRLYGFMRSCDSRKKHALHAASPSSNASTRGESESGWPKKPRRNVCFPFDALMQSKDLERDAKHLVTLRRATHTANHPSHTHIGPPERQKHNCARLILQQLSKSLPLATMLATYQLLSFHLPPRVLPLLYIITHTDEGQPSCIFELAKVQPFEHMSSLPSASLSPRALIKISTGVGKMLKHETLWTILSSHTN
jgi:hypothetical protein